MFLDEQESTDVVSLLKFVDLGLSHPPCNIWDSREDINPHYDGQTLDAMADAIALCKQLTRPRHMTNCFDLLNNFVKGTSLQDADSNNRVGGE